jgi:hypothetical protein
MNNEPRDPGFIYPAGVCVRLPARPRHDHYGPRDNCSIDCPAHPEHPAGVSDEQ